MIRNNLKTMLCGRDGRSVVTLFVPYVTPISSRLRLVAVAFLVFNIYESLYEQRFVSFYLLEYFQTCKNIIFIPS